MKKAFTILFLFNCLYTFAQQLPNIIIILADDLDNVITPQFFPELLPMVDSMKRTGIDFTNSFTPMAICCPSRAATLTGQYAHNNGVYRNIGKYGGWKGFRHNEPYTVAAHLSQNGYRTAIMGKYLNGYKAKRQLPPILYGWTDGSVFAKGFYYKGYDYGILEWEQGQPENDTVWTAENIHLQKYGREDEDYSTDVLTEKAVSFIENTAIRQEPFFLFLNPTSPHFPLPAAPRHEQLTKDRWLNVSIPTMPNSYNDKGALANEDEQSIPLDKSSWLRNSWRKRIRQKDRGLFYYRFVSDKMPSYFTGRSFHQAMFYHRMGSLYALNDMIVTVMKTLRKTGQWENTLLIFTSDNGFQFGNHGLQHKGTPYEESIKVPMVMMGGESLDLKESTEVTDWVLNLDLAPTIIDLAGLPVPEEMDGKSLLPLIKASSKTENEFRDRFVMEYIGPGMVYHSNPRLMNRIAPSFVMDHPTYNAIRMKVADKENGDTVRVFKYIEWERHPGNRKFREKLKTNDEKLMQKVAKGKKRILKKLAKVQAVETELYDLTADPYEMDNLLYYKPEEYKEIAQMMKAAMFEMIRE